MDKRVFLIMPFAVLVFLSSFVYGAIPASERAALIALYNSTNGDYWNNNYMWKMPPLDTDGFAMPGTEGSWDGVTVSGDTIIKIDLYNNNLNGTIPSQLGNLSNLQGLRLSDNWLSGTIPSQLGNLSKLFSLCLNNNQLSGSIPSQLGNLSKLQRLELDGNNLSGTIPSQLGNLYTLIFLYLHNNQLSGSIPSQLGNLSKLFSLWLSNNQLSGPIPMQLGNLYQLEILSLSNNLLSGEIPSSLTNLKKVSYFDIRYNCLYANDLTLRAWLDSKDPDWEDHQDQCVSPTPTITVTAPDGGESWNVGSSQIITWATTGTVGNVKIEYSTDSGSSWSTITSSTANDGSYSWVVPDTPSSQCLVRIEETSDGKPSDTSNAVFAIYKSANTITVSAPDGGESWNVSSSQIITWATTGTVGNVKIEYSTDSGSNWSTITSSTANDGSYSWVVPDTPSSQCLVRIEEASDGKPSDTSNTEFTIYKYTPPEISLNRSHLYFGATTAGTATAAQTVIINNIGGGTLAWTAYSETVWLSISPNSGIGHGVITISINPSGLSIGTFTGFITVSDPYAGNSPQTTSVALTIYDDGSTTIPFGEFATPAHGATVSGSIPVTGWALDDIGVENVKIYRGEGKNLIYIGDAVFVEGARPDVEQSYPEYPMNYKAGWGYMMLTNFLPNGGNGTFKIHAIATDIEGNQITLGTKTIICDNANAVKPFGAIDTPEQGGTASGSSFVNFGWALTPMPNTIPTDGSTITVWVDGVPLGTPVYNQYRKDIATLFPDYNNSNGAVGYFYLDTTQYENGVHTIQWTVADDVGNTDGIGSRYFTIQNIENSQSKAYTTSSIKVITDQKFFRISQLADIPLNDFESIRVKKGLKDDFEPEVVSSDKSGVFIIKTEELERIVIELSRKSTVIEGYMKVGDELRLLPIGATLDTRKGIFYWQPGPGFVGHYQLVFIERSEDNQIKKINIIVSIEPKSANKEQLGVVQVCNHF